MGKQLSSDFFQSIICIGNVGGASFKINDGKVRMALKREKISSSSFTSSIGVIVADMGVKFTTSANNTLALSK